jgi:hypothetical protein
MDDPSRPAGCWTEIAGSNAVVIEMFARVEQCYSMMQNHCRSVSHSKCPTCCLNMQ